MMNNSTLIEEPDGERRNLARPVAMTGHFAAIAFVVFPCCGG
jgi:hypothetical protein